MSQALWVAKTGLDAQQTRLSVISNNLANVNTFGFKKDRAVFNDLLYQTVRQPGSQSSQSTELPSGLMLGTGVRVVATEKIHSIGSIFQTDNSLDVAISGNGFFEILNIKILELRFKFIDLLDHWLKFVCRLVAGIAENFV